uniref:G protein pathway suppressor 2 n=1 Tax=Astyanax mexicanus TaxID=7994 RepID=A0A8B9KPF8_ASTMX
MCVIEEEEVDKMMEQKLKEEEERKRKKEMEERMSLEETKEQIMKMGEKLQGLQEEKHQLFLQLKKVLHEEEKRRRKEQRCFNNKLSSNSSAVSLPSSSPCRQRITANRIGLSVHYSLFALFALIHQPSAYVGASAFPAMQYLPHQQQGYAVHSHFTSQPGFLPSASIPLQKQLEHANQQSGFTDSSTLRPMHPQALHANAAGLLPTPPIAVQIPSAKTGLPYAHPPRPASPGAFTHTATFQSSSQPPPRHAYLSHSQSGQRFYHHGK